MRWLKNPNIDQGLLLINNAKFVLQSLSTAHVVIQLPEKRQWVRYSHPEKILQTCVMQEVVAVLQQVEALTRQGYYACGLVSYEAGPAFEASLKGKSVKDFPLIWFGLFRHKEEIRFPARNSIKSDKERVQIDWQSEIGQAEYQQALLKIKDYIRAGDSYQVNHTFRLRAQTRDAGWPLFVEMVYAQNLSDRVGYCAYIETQDWCVCSASPELFITLDDEKLVSKPMKGTAPRGYSHEDDVQAAQYLRHSKKNCAENIMIADMVRNDMGRIAQVGSVYTSEILSLEKYPTFWSMTSTVTCKTEANHVEIFRALFPAASITGAPKIRASEIINEIEHSPRKAYSGSIGVIEPNGFSQFNVAIRTVILDKRTNQAEFGVGGGIVWDSKPDDEFQECATKSRVLTYFQPEFELLETLRWDLLRGYHLLSQHLKRLQQSAEYFSWQIDIEKIRIALEKAANDFSFDTMRVRLIVCKDQSISIASTPITSLASPYKLCLSPRAINSRNYFLYHKTTNRDVYENIRALVEQRKLNFNDVVLFNESGEITETLIANIVIESEGKKRTPSVRCGLLNGVARQVLINQGVIEEAVITVEQLKLAKKIWLINSVRNWWQGELLN